MLSSVIIAIVLKLFEDSLSGLFFPSQYGFVILNKLLIPIYPIIFHVINHIIDSFIISEKVLWIEMLRVLREHLRPF